MEDPNTKLKDFILTSLKNNDLKDSRRALNFGIGFSCLIWGYFKLFNNFHPLKRPVVISCVFGMILNFFSTLSSEIFEISTENTKLSAKLRAVHQEASLHDQFIPYFRNETLNALNSRKKTEEQNNN